MNDSANRIQLHPSWKQRLAQDFEQPYMVELRRFLLAERRRGADIFPPPKEWFAALDAAPFDAVRVVILGQDPYHGPSQAHGLCFSVRTGVPCPPSLVNIAREVADCIRERGEQSAPLAADEQGCLSPWARQGVLLLNSALTVERGRAASHRGKGWEPFTNRVVECLNQERERLVFMLWGSDARRKGAGIDRHKHLVLETVHPSPLSAHRGFLGCRHFALANAYLAEHGLDPIDWRIAPT